MTKRVYSGLETVARTLFFLLLVLNLINWIIAVSTEMTINVLPFSISETGEIVAKQDGSYKLLESKVIISLDSLNIEQLSVKSSNFINPLEKNEMQFNPFQQGLQTLSGKSELNKVVSNYIRTREEVEITYLEEDSELPITITVKTVKQLNKSRLLILIFNIIFMFFIFFNTYLILNFSQNNENFIIVYFFLLMAFPERIPFIDLSQFTMFMITPFLGVLFYHYARQKTPTRGSTLYLYIVTLISAVSLYVLKKVSNIDISPLLIVWSVFWFIYSFAVLGRSYKISQSIEIKRLINAFRGILISLICLVIAGILLFSIFLISGGMNLQITGLSSIILFSFIILAGFGFLLGILWFFGSFTWGLLTGTVLDVKIRSTLIVTIVGVLFVTGFGLVDYTLGELLQSLFGNFIGSEFIAGIPATIGLLVFFNPIRNRVESLVDTKLNTSDLDFLEKADTFSENLTEDGVIEGFEEYICENLMQRLPIKKVALISYSHESKGFIFNEIRGSDVIENSLVDDIHEILLKDEIYKSYVVNENEQDVSSFSFILPIIYEESYKWFLALGRKIDGSVYSRKDEAAFVKLTNKIKLSLKFILAYDDIVTNKYLGKIKDKNLLIKKYEAEIESLRNLVDGEKVLDEI